MNLQGIVAGVVAAVNPPTVATLTPSAGYTIAPDGTQVPAYGQPVSVMAQIQALTSRDLRQLDALNLQGAQQAAYLPGQWNGVLRPENKGGDLLQFNGQTWLIVAVLEQWPDWTRAAVALQNGS